MSPTRSIHLAEGIWRYRIGKSYAVILSPSGKRSNIGLGKLKGCCPSLIERGQWKKTSDGMVYPREVRAHIEVNLTTPCQA